MKKIKDDHWTLSIEEKRAIIKIYQKLLNNIMKKISNFIIDLATIFSYISKNNPSLKMKENILKKLVESSKQKDCDKLMKLLGKIIEAERRYGQDGMDGEFLKIIRTSKEIKKCYKKACMIKERINQVSF